MQDQEEKSRFGNELRWTSGIILEHFCDKGYRTKLVGDTLWSTYFLEIVPSSFEAITECLKEKS